MSKPRTIGIGLVEHMGDIVACEPVARYLRAENPEARILWCVREPYRELIDTNPNVDETLVVRCCTEWIALAESGCFDEVVDLHINGRICPTCRVPLVKRKGNLDVAELTYLNYGGLLTAFSIGAGLPPLTDAPRVYIPRSTAACVDALSLPPSFVVLHAKTNEQVKDWPPEQWLQCIRTLVQEMGVTVVEVGLDPVLPPMPGLVQLCGKLSILETAEVIRRAALFVGVDSGPSHLANAVETFGVILVGPYKVYTKYNPYSGNYATGANCRLVYSPEGVAAIPVPDVVKAVAEGLRLASDAAPFRATLQQFETQARSIGAGPAPAPAARVIAFYLPQFHPVPENDRWWGKGFTEWTNTATARPLFPGHYQPHVPGELGFYDLRLPEARQAQADLARTFGIEGFCYWHYWFNGKKLLERPVEEMLASGKPDLPFCLAWANESWTRRWDGAEKQVLQAQGYGGDQDTDAHFAYLLQAFRDPRCITVDGMPLFLIYRPLNLPHAHRILDRWRELAHQAGLPGLFLVSLRTVFEQGKTDYRSLGFDGVIQHQPNWERIFRYRDASFRTRPAGFITPNTKQGRADQEPLVFDSRESTAWFWALNNERVTDADTFPTVVCSWDNSPRVGRRATLLHGTSPEDLAVWLSLEIERVKDRTPDRRLIFVNAWNEWAEGMHLEPDLRHGTTMLEAVRWARERGCSLSEAFSRKVVSRMPAVRSSTQPRTQPAPMTLETLHEAIRRMELTGTKDPSSEDSIRELIFSAERQRATLTHDAAGSPLDPGQRQKAAEMKNASARLHALLAAFYVHAGAYERADAMFSKALTIDAKAVRAARDVAEQMVKQGFLGVSAELFSGLVQDHPDDVSLWVSLGSALEAMRRYDDAGKVFSRVLQVRPGNRQAKLFLSKYQAAQAARQPHAVAPTSRNDPAVGAPQAEVEKFLETVGPFHLHCGGIGDALLLLAAACRQDEQITIISVSQSAPAVKELFSAFPGIRRVHHLPWPPSIEAHQALRRLLSRHPLCLGMGVTPAGDYFTEWHPGLDIAGRYGVQLHPQWTAAFKSRPETSPQVVLQPAGGRSPLTGQAKAFTPDEWRLLLRRLETLGVRPLVIGHASERTLFPAGAAADKRGEPLRRQMELIASADLVIGADSWAKTFAALCEVPALVLHSTRGKTVQGLSEVGDHVFLKPWPSITVFSSFEELLGESARRLSPPAETTRRRLGIVWEGSQFVNHSLALINRELCARVIEAGHDVSILPYEPDEFSPDPGSRYVCITDRVNRTLKEQHVHIRHQWPPDLTPPPRGHWVMIQPWEFGSLPAAWIPALRSGVDELWVPSRYVRDVALAGGVPADRVAVVPNGVDTALFSPHGSAFSFRTRKRFRFLFVGGTIHRKGIDVLLQAYVSSFSRNDDVCLVIKDMGGKSFYKGQTLADAIRGLAGDHRCPEIEYIDRILPPGDMAALYRSCHVLTHPYRGEGFGLPVLEAMACGLPAIVSRGGACDDFCTGENSFKIRAERRDLKERRVGDLDTIGVPWLLEPDAAELREQMKRAAAAPEMLAAVGKQARHDVERSWSWDHAVRIAEQRLSEIVKRPIRRFMTPEEPPALPGEPLQRLGILFRRESYDEALHAAGLLYSELGEEALNEQTRRAQSGLKVFMGQCHLAKNNLEAARHEFERALEIVPDSSPACSGLGELFRRAGLAEASKTMFEWAVKNDRHNEAALMGLETVNRSLGLSPHDNRLAVDDPSTCISIAPVTG